MKANGAHGPLPSSPPLLSSPLLPSINDATTFFGYNIAGRSDVAEAAKAPTGLLRFRLNDRPITMSIGEKVIRRDSASRFEITRPIKRGGRGKGGELPIHCIIFFADSKIRICEALVRHCVKRKGESEESAWKRGRGGGRPTNILDVVSAVRHR